MANYGVKGMSCAACQARVEKAVNGVDGVTSCTVSLLTNSMSVEGTASPDVICAAVKAAGYRAKLSAGEISFDDDTAQIRNRLIISAVILAVLMYFSMGVMMLGWPMPFGIPHSHVTIAVTEMVLSGVILWINRIFFIRGMTGLVHRSPNMDTLVSLGSGISWLWSLYILVRIISAHNSGDMELAGALSMNLYFESAAMILVLITVGKLLEAVSKGRTTSALRGLMELRPQTALLYRDGEEVSVPIEEVGVGDIYIVKAGDYIPVDGVVIEGECRVDESALTGESELVAKAAGDHVSAATISGSGRIRCRAEKVGEDTTLAQIIKLVSDAAVTKAPIARVADRVSAVFVPAVIGIACVTFIVWMLTGAEVGYALERAISVLVISCPCALGLATPVAIMVANGRGARSGILFKTSEAIETTGRVRNIVLDKTGTVTEGVIIDDTAAGVSGADIDRTAGDRIRPDSAEAIRELKAMGIRVAMISGDKEAKARAIADEAGIDEVIAEVMPADKSDKVEEMKKTGCTIMIGDGINDAPALTIADVGMAIGAGTDIAMDAADVVLVKSSLMDAVSAIRLSRKTLTNIHQNLFWAFIYNCIGIPLAAGCFIPLTGWTLTPMFGAAAMSLSSVCVVTNALRLNHVKIS